MRKTKIIRRAAITIILATLVVMFVMLFMCSCHPDNTKEDVKATLAIGDKLSQNQPTPTDIDYSLERYNLIKRAYWVNGQREKANTLVCAVEKPLGYIVLFTDAGGVVGSFVVDGKVSSLNSFLTPESMYYECVGDYVAGGTTGQENEWIPDVDGSYGENDAGIFFFTTDGKYIEWTGTYLYSDIPFIVDDPIVKIGE
jgi:hypothetical protein